jgi:hypothetical protein
VNPLYIRVVAVHDAALQHGMQPTVYPIDKDVMCRIRDLQQVLLHTVPIRNHGNRPKCVLYSMVSWNFEAPNVVGD